MRKVDPEKYEAQMRKILDAARFCFARKGFHQTTTAAICAQAGMSPGNLFHYFSGKQAIIAAIVDAEGSETAAYFARILQADDLYAELLSFMDVVLQLAADQSYASLALEISAEAMRDTDIGARVSRNDTEMRAALEALLASAMTRGQIDATLPPSDVATWIAALIDGIFSRVAIDPAFRPAKQGKTMRLLLARMLRPDAAQSSA